MGGGCNQLETSDSTVGASNVSPRSDASLHHIDNPRNSVARSSIVVPETISNACLSWWNRYCRIVRRHQVSLDLLDEGICRLLFWLPHQDSSEGGSPSTWREIVFGLLSVNRLTMQCSQLSVLERSYATSVQVENPNIPATSFRIALSIIHCLMPSLLGMVHHDPMAPELRQTYLRFCLERLKFCLRILLLVSYWKQASTCIPMGILLDGGMFYDNQLHGLSEEQANNLERRRQYVGWRTGLQLVATEKPEEPAATTALKTMLAELLYVLRPLYWAYSEHQHHHAVDRENNQQPSISLLEAWMTTITMDIVSYRILQSSQSRNRWSATELNRRRMKIFLYLLRSPIWSHVTSPILSKGSEIIRKFPVLGSFADACIWDWILYHKQAYVSEEG